MVEHELVALVTRVRFPLATPEKIANFKHFLWLYNWQESDNMLLFSFKISSLINKYINLLKGEKEDYHGKGSF